MAVLWRLLVGMWSVGNLVVGLALLVWSFVDRSQPVTVLLIGAALMLQGVATLLSPGLGLRRVLAAGSLVALAVGAAAFVVTLAGNLSPESVDPEHGPLAMALLLGGHGAAVLWAHRRRYLA